MHKFMHTYTYTYTYTYTDTYTNTYIYVDAMRMCISLPFRTIKAPNIIVVITANGDMNTKDKNNNHNSSGRASNMYHK